jgi:hypothetical protein
MGIRINVQSATLDISHIEYGDEIISYSLRGDDSTHDLQITADITNFGEEKMTESEEVIEFIRSEIRTSSDPDAAASRWLTLLTNEIVSETRTLRKGEEK